MDWRHCDRNEPGAELDGEPVHLKVLLFANPKGLQVCLLKHRAAGFVQDDNTHMKDYRI